MGGHTFFGKQRLCYTEVTDFTDFQGIGRDPMYKRYDSVFSVVKRTVPEDLQHFLATPEYLIDVDQICWHIEQWNEYPSRLSDLTGVEYDKYKNMFDATIDQYKTAICNLNGEDLTIMAGAIKYIDEQRAYCSNGKVYIVAWGMTPDTKQHKVIGSVIHEFNYIKKFRITFNVGESGKLESLLHKSINRAEGVPLTEIDTPTVIPNEGWKFDGWTPSPNGHIVTADMTFTANYSKIELPKEPSTPLIAPPLERPEKPKEQCFNCTFNSGDYGTLIGASSIQKLSNTKLENGEIPNVNAMKGYDFIGWDISPFDCVIDKDKHFIAQYKKQNIPWYRRWWLWLTGLFLGKGCLKWLMLFLLSLVLLWLLSWLLRGCVGCSDFYSPINGVVPIDTISTEDGRTIDDNGFIYPVTGKDGELPDDRSIVAPTLGEGGTEIPIVKQPGAPNTIANRLFLFLEDENDNIEALAHDFKKTYPSEKYSIIGYDKEVKLLVIQIPEEERSLIKITINEKIPNHKFIVFDEEIYELNGSVNIEPENLGWHLKAIHLQEAWRYTKGSSNIKVAVVDDGIQSSHPMFAGRIVDAYNVFTQDNRLSIGDGHGTHTAGLAVGSDQFFAKGVSGVAPNCKLMPIQVFDNNQCPLSALVSGIMYAIHHDADVVNISIAPSFAGLNQLPVNQQEQIARNQFKNVEMLWTRVCSLAARKNSILVFAAGNDDILSSIPPENRNASAIVVTAVDKHMYPTEFTNYGPCSDISAPGKDILSSFPNSSYKSFDGTSMAAPIVTGTIALMKSIKKDITVLQARNVLYSTGADVYGFIPPMVLADKALIDVINGNFSTPKERPLRPVLGGGGDKFSGNNSGQLMEEPISNKQPSPSDETDYDTIRRKIADYKKKINELEKLLPNKQN